MPGPESYFSQDLDAVSAEAIWVKWFEFLITTTFSLLESVRVTVTGQLADWTTRGLVNSCTGQLVDWTTRGLDNSRMPPATLLA